MKYKVVWIESNKKLQKIETNSYAAAFQEYFKHMGPLTMAAIAELKADGSRVVITATWED